MWIILCDTDKQVCRISCCNSFRFKPWQNSLKLEQDLPDSKLLSTPVLLKVGQYLVTFPDIVL